MGKKAKLRKARRHAKVELYHSRVLFQVFHDRSIPVPFFDPELDMPQPKPNLFDRRNQSWRRAVQITHTVANRKTEFGLLLIRLLEFSTTNQQKLPDRCVFLPYQSEVQSIADRICEIGGTALLGAVIALVPDFDRAELITLLGVE